MLLTVPVPNDVVIQFPLPGTKAAPALFLLLEHKEASIGLPAAV